MKTLREILLYYGDCDFNHHEDSLNEAIKAIEELTEIPFNNKCIGCGDNTAYCAECTRLLQT